ncbi:MAG: glucosamine-6-phosphate deaminase [Patescibacteria group bacterium]|nr:glucosamine-6-phosphate deaminase [Patescibacteria group bacterium]
MYIIIKKNYEELSKQATVIVKQKILAKPNLVLGLATGSTPLGLYQELIRTHQKEGLDFSEVTTFNLDEYAGLAPSHPQSYNYYMRENLFKHINIKKENVFIPKGIAENIEESCQQYEYEIKKRGGIDLQILGIGRDGHIGFNEPGTSFASRTHIVNLDSVTIEDNARFFENKNEVPRRAITMGIGTIMEAKECLMLVNGAHKAEIIARALQGQITEKVPASVLQKHPNLTVILDEEAAVKLKA